MIICDIYEVLNMTYKELAKQLNISPAALSLILNNKPGVSDATRTNVLKSVRDMGLESMIKQAPAAATVISNNLCFLIYKRHGEILDLHPFFLLLMENIENYARQKGYNILLYTIDRRRPMEEQIAQLNSLNVRGVIIFGTEMQDDDIEPFFSLPIPFVVMDNDLTRISCNSVSINNQMGTYQAIEHLTSLGHTRIGYLKSRIRINSFRERHMGYISALRHFGLQFDENNIFTISYSEEGSYRDLRHFLEEHKNISLPSAFVCDDDTIAVGAMRALKETGHQIPETISVVGFNDRPSCEDTIPSLTSISVSKYAFAIETVDELLRMIARRGHTSPEVLSRKIRIGTKLIVRNSTSKNLLP